MGKKCKPYGRRYLTITINYLLNIFIANLPQNGNLAARQPYSDYPS
jgi:hypothetical protein